MPAMNSRRAFIATLFAGAVSLGLVACGDHAPGGDPPAVSCSPPPAPTVSSATATASGSSPRVAVPAWSADIGRPSAVVGGTVFGTAGAHCYEATDIATGDVDWTVGASSEHPWVFDVIADNSTVLAAAGIQVGQAPAMVASVVDQLVAYDPTTGHARWSITIPNDGQRMPGLLTGSAVVVAEADGSLLGLNERNGHLLWRDPAPSGCGGNPMDGLQPDAAVIGVGSAGGDAVATVAFACPGGGSVAAVDPLNGARRWTWRIPTGWEVDPQMTDEVDPGGSDRPAVAAAIGLTPPANAPAEVRKVFTQALVRARVRAAGARAHKATS